MPEEEAPLGRSLPTPHKGHYIESPPPTSPRPGYKVKLYPRKHEIKQPFFSDKGICDETTQLNKLASPFFCKALNNVFQGCGPELIAVFSYEYTIFLVPQKRSCYHNKVPSVRAERLLCNILPCQNPAVYQVINTKCFVTPKCIVLRKITDIKVIVK